MDTTKVGDDDLEEVQDSGHPYDCVPDGVSGGACQAFLACASACAGFADEGWVLVHLGFAHHVRDLLRGGVF